MKNADVGVETYGHDAGDGRAHFGAPCKEAWPYPLRSTQVMAWLEVVRPHARHGTATPLRGRGANSGRALIDGSCSKDARTRQ